MTNGSVKDYMKNHGPLPEKTALKYFYETCEALQVLHHDDHLNQKRIIHRDIKCANLLLTEDDNIKLADFGLTFSLEVNSFSMTMSAQNSDEMDGTMLFTAPEVLLASNYGRGADIWSLACTLVEMLTDHPPHEDIYSANRTEVGALESFLKRISSIQPDEQLEYSGKLVPTASEEIRLLLDCLFTRNTVHRPKIDDIINLFVSTSADGTVSIDHQKVILLKTDILLSLKTDILAMNILHE